MLIGSVMLPNRRRDGAVRLLILESGRSDPWRYDGPGVRGYEDAAHHLLAHGLTPAPNIPAMREMWKAGAESRWAVQIITQRWELAA
jgi:hypothetical protein